MAEHYLSLHRKCLEEAQYLILKGDYVQASEKPARGRAVAGND